MSYILSAVFQRLTLILLFSFPVSLFASGDLFHSGGKAVALSDASVTLSDIFAINYNQAGLAHLKSPTFGIFAERRYLSAGINLFSAAIGIPTNSGTFGLSLNFYGFSLYNESKIGLAYAREFGKKFSIGLQFDYLRLQIEEYGNKSAFTFELGMQYQLLETVRVGAHIYNPLRIHLDDVYQETLLTILKFGFAWSPSEKVMIAGEFEKDLDFEPVIKFGLDYKMLPIIAVRAGIATNPIKPSFGIGLDLKQFQLDAGATFHPSIGYSPNISIIYQIKKKTESTE